MISADSALRLLDTTEVQIKRAERWGFIPKAVKGAYQTADLVRGFSRFLASGEVTITDAGAFIGATDQWVRKLIAEGYIPKNSRGNVVLMQVCQGYIRWLKDEDRRSSKVSADTALKAVRQREVELRIERETGKLCDTEDALAAIDTVVGVYRSELSGLAARVTRDIPTRRKIEAEVNGSLGRITKVIEAQAAALEAGGGAVAAAAEDDA